MQGVHRRCLLSALVCIASIAPARVQTPSLADLAWLAGTWTGAAGSARVEEHWIPPEGGLMLGVSRTVAAGRAVGFEFLRIEQRPDGVYYVAQPGGRPPTDFELTHRAADTLVFENPQHDHPKVIRYRLTADGTLVVEVEGDEDGRPVKQAFTYARATGR